jgi:hypothetical protein
VIDRIKDIVVDRVHSVSVVPLLFGLARRKVPQVRFSVNLVMDVVVERSPVSDFHLVMRVVGSSIEDVDVSCVERSACIALPQITVNQTLYAERRRYQVRWSLP